MNAIAIRQSCRKRYRAQQKRDDQAHRKYTLNSEQHQISASDWPLIAPMAETPFPTAVKAGTIAPFLRNGILRRRPSSSFNKASGRKAVATARCNPPVSLLSPPKHED
jgi:hypothetical protein